MCIRDRSAWGFKPHEFISVRINLGLGDGRNPNGTNDQDNATGRFTREADGPALRVPGGLKWTQLESREWKARFVVEKCPDCSFSEGLALTGYPTAPRERIIMSATVEQLLTQRFQFVLDQEALPAGITEDAAIQAAVRAVPMSKPNELVTPGLVLEQVADCVMEADEMEKRCVPMTYAMEMEFEEEAAAKQNLFLRINRFVQRRVLLCTRHCLMGSCYEPIPPVLQGLKPIVCGKELCQKQASRQGGSLDLCAEIRRAPQVFDLLVSLTYLGATGSPNPLLLPFPKNIPGATEGTGRVFHGDNTLLKGVRGTKFSSEVKKGDSIYLTETLPDGKVATSPRIVVQEVRSDTELVLAERFPYADREDDSSVYIVCQRSVFVDMDQGQEVAGTQKYAKIIEALNLLPAVQLLVETLEQISEAAVDNFESDVNTLFGRWLKSLTPWKDDRLLNLLQYIVSTNRGHLRLLEEHERIKGVEGMHKAGGQHQFVMLCGNPEREKLFREAKQRCEDEKGVGNGSIMAFHAGAACVWNSIVRGGLDYRWMRNAQAFGPGVYLATNQQTSNSPGYCTPGNSWPSSALGVSQVKIMAVCEMINRPEAFRGAPNVSTTKYKGRNGNCPHYVVQHVGDRDHPTWLKQEGKPLYETDPEFAGEDWVMAKVMMFGENGSGGSMCQDCTQLKPPEVSMTPQIAQGAGLQRLPSSVKKGSEGRSGGQVVRVKSAGYDDEYKLYLRAQLVELIQMGFPPHKSWLALSETQGGKESAIAMLVSEVGAPGESK
eukprot:TRINITY_DN3629_c0_g1_i1.p1 TRINITY_DN3629_c0_g1~~TRINITY_DN3629_c0_g1_i1.p1  ORF type:complete len:774 (-),score=253.76 TRINITY_DN3629_c0_g1_i1:113-2434(-)